MNNINMEELIKFALAEMDAQELKYHLRKFVIENEKTSPGQEKELQQLTVQIQTAQLFIHILKRCCYV